MYEPDNSFRVEPAADDNLIEVIIQASNRRQPKNGIVDYFDIEDKRRVGWRQIYAFDDLEFERTSQ